MKSEPLVHLMTLRLTLRQRRALQQLARDRGGMPLSTLMRVAIDEYLKIECDPSDFLPNYVNNKD